MTGFDPNTWYTLTTLLQSPNDTLTAGQDSQTAFDPNSPSAVYLAPVASDPPPHSQLWQLLSVNDSSTSAYILRNRQLGANAYLTTAWTTRKCGGGNCATVPVLAPYLNAESLWEFGSWGFSDVTGAAFVYNLGNGSNWRLDVMDGGTEPEMNDDFDTGRGGQHWNATAYETFAASDSTSFGPTPTSALAILAQMSTAAVASSTIVPYTAPGVTSGATHASTAAPGASATTSANGSSSTGAVSSQKSSGLSTGASIGIGVGIAGLVFVIMAIVGVLLFRCYRNKKRSRQTMSQSASSGETSPTDKSSVTLDAGSKQPLATKVELHNNQYSEMPPWHVGNRAELGQSSPVHELHS